MKPSEFLQALQAFFFDFIGAVVPGTVLLVGLIIVLSGPGDLQSVTDVTENTSWILFVVGAYVLGNIVVGIGGILTKGAANKIRSDLLDHPSVRAFQEQAASVGQAGNTAKERGNMFGTLRNMAMSRLTEDKATTYRFMFIALFHLGTAVSVALCIIAFWLLIAFKALRNDLSLVAVDWLGSVLVSAILLLVCCVLFVRWKEFYERSMRLPFPAALAKQSSSADEEADLPIAPQSRSGLPLRVYLAGGFRSGWQDQITLDQDVLIAIDPRTHGLWEENSYSTWDLAAIRSCDILFAYAETTNPALYALSLEVGYARALGKLIILVEEHPNEERRRYFGMLRACADARFEAFEEAVDFLKSLATAGMVVPEHTKSSL